MITPIKLSDKSPTFPCEMRATRVDGTPHENWHAIENESLMHDMEYLGLEWHSWRPLPTAPTSVPTSEGVHEPVKGQTTADRMAEFSMKVDENMKLFASPTPPQAQGTPTPRTDALSSVPMTRKDSDDFARTLERELAAKDAENNDLMANITDQRVELDSLAKAQGYYTAAHAATLAKLEEAKASLAKYEKEKWTIRDIEDLYYEESGSHLIDFILTYMLREASDQLGKHGWDAYESDGGLEEAIGYEVCTLLRKAGVMDDEDNAPTHLKLKAQLRSQEAVIAERDRMAERLAWSQQNESRQAEINCQLIKDLSAVTKERDAIKFADPEHWCHEVDKLRAQLEAVTKERDDNKRWLERAKGELQFADAALKTLRAAPAAQPINTHVRLFDLVRYQRAELHAADLITDEECAWLSGGSDMGKSKDGGSPSWRRLEDYDQLRKVLAAQAEQLKHIQETHKRDGNWLDKQGCCKVCDGEIPHGHTEDCDIWKLEREVKALTEQLAALNKDYINLEKEYASTCEQLAAANDWRETLFFWGSTPQIVDAFIKGQQTRIHACQDIEKELTAARKDSARLDWLSDNPIHTWGFGHFTGSVTMNGEPYSSMRAAIDAAMSPATSTEESK